MTAISATFSDFKIIKSRSACQIILEIPIEQADNALIALGGVPQPGCERWIGIAPLKKAIVAGSMTPQAPSRKFSELPLSTQAALMCGRPDFQDWIKGTHLYENVEDGVRDICGVASRSELDRDADAAARWKKLYGDWEHYSMGYRP